MLINFQVLLVHLRLNFNNCNIPTKGIKNRYGNRIVFYQDEQTQKDLLYKE